MNLRAYFRLFTQSFVANLGAAMEYRVNFLIQVLGMMLNNGAFLVFWAVLFDKVGSLSGYAFSDVMFLWALTSSAFGLAHILCGNIHSIGQIIQRGDLDVYLLQPKNVLFSVAVSRTRVSAWGDFLYGFGVLAFLTLDPFKWLLFLGFTITGAVIFASTFIMAESLTFFFGSSQGITKALKEVLIAFSLYPESVFPIQVRWTFYSLIPAAWLVFIPLSVFRSFDWVLLCVVLGAAIVYLIGAVLVFRSGLKRYESGNQIGARV